MRPRHTHALTLIPMTPRRRNVTKLKPKGAPPILGWYVSQLKTIATLPPHLTTDLVAVRNAAIHQNHTPSNEYSWTALDLAKHVLELHDPLPA